MIATQSSRHGLRSDRFRILVLEDEALVREVTCEVLKSVGFAVLQAETATQAKRILGQGAIDLLVCDWVLPDGDGFNLVREALDSNPCMRALLASGYPEITGNHRLPARADFIAKPFTASSLIAQVRAMLAEEDFLSAGTGLER